MATYGMLVYDSQGGLLFDAEKLKHRVWWTGIVTSTGTYLYDEALSHAPTVVCFSIGTSGDGMVWEHVQQGGLYTGFQVIEGTRETLFVVFARR